MAGRLVLLRHGQSEWNLSNQFTGWVDVELTEKGEHEARVAGQLMAESAFRFDIVYTSMLTRAIRTMWLALAEMGQSWVDVKRHWRLNERHYGALQGLDKAQMAAKHGDEQVHIWRRSYDVPPPAMSEQDAGHPRNDPRYSALDPRVLPGTESLKLTLERVLPFWHDQIAPSLLAGEDVLVAAHGNSLRALVKYLDDVPDDEITGLNIPTGIPLCYRLDDSLNAVESSYLGDADVAQAAANTVANQAGSSSGQ
ncbi:2,3-diphosphoglycerate-dependent phosphoglycerate mutase [Salinisphaera sp. USBA-960]|uniref:2,3-diphosphoglycerate-dependent phosphoglycerate mutase n=1 Tax=Salinisphaera orenii TaxID=856731 RepID=UPI000DBE22EC|nr:2,3-diphosphoglycerate-dependent phosphoglycerate mutase [Salifodinibacter halophilus]NNC25403.1 2,3-diphosphoglycerate-dependent phosphoglycerate mutase [Salifodinibacter halophilus]